MTKLEAPTVDARALEAQRLDAALAYEADPAKRVEMIRAALAQPAAPDHAGLVEMERRKDAAYEERNKVVAALARLFPSGLKNTNIPGWSEDWHGCVYIDLPTGQVSWHFHDSQRHLFDGLPAYQGEWDGHDTDEKYRRLSALSRAPVAVAVKPLEWQKKSHGKDEFADTPCGRYEVGIVHGGYLATIRVVREGQWDDEVFARGLCAKSEAKAAAQADYEKRIRSALATPPAGDAAQPAADGWKKGDLVWYDSQFGRVNAQVRGYVEGWVELAFADGSTAICRPSRISARAASPTAQEGGTDQ